MGQFLLAVVAENGQESGDNVLELFLAQHRPDRIENWSMYFRCTLNPFILYKYF